MAAKKRTTRSTTSRTGGKMCPNPSFHAPAPIKVPTPQPKQRPRVRITMPDQRGRIA